MKLIIKMFEGEQKVIEDVHSLDYYFDNETFKYMLYVRLKKPINNEISLKFDTNEINNFVIIGGN